MPTLASTSDALQHRIAAGKTLIWSFHRFTQRASVHTSFCAPKASTDEAPEAFFWTSREVGSLSSEEVFLLLGLLRRAEFGLQTDYFQHHPKTKGWILDGQYMKL